MEAETWHLPEYRCLAPSLRPVAESTTRVRTTGGGRQSAKTSAALGERLRYSQDMLERRRLVARRESPQEVT